MQFIEFALFRCDIINWIVLLPKGNEDKFYKPVIGFLEGWKIEWDPQIAESHDATFYQKSERHFQIIFNGSNFCFRKKR